METSKLYAVFGNPILHSKSPQLFNEAFEAIKMNCFYTRIRPQSAENIVKLIRELPLAGANITAPFKEDVLKILDFITDDAQRIGAVNTIVNSNGRLVGHNTDHCGVTESLLDAGISLKKASCLVLGGGGGARAAVYGLINKGANVTICNRTFSKALAIANDFGCDLLDWSNFDTSITFEIVISTLLPEAYPWFLEELDFTYLLDASYKDSKASDIAMDIGARVIFGEKWLLYQAAEAFKLLTGIVPPVRTMEQGFSKKLRIDNLNISCYPPFGFHQIVENKIDLLIDAFELDDQQQKRIVDEETDKAFGC